MFITIFTCPTENEYLALPQFACRNAESKCFFRLSPCSFDNVFKQHSHRLCF